MIFQLPSCCTWFAAPTHPVPVPAPAPAPAQWSQGFGHAVYCARHALGISDCGGAETHNGANNGSSASVASVGGDKAGGNGRSYAHKHGENGGVNGLGRGGEHGASPATGAGVESNEDESFLLVLGDHLYRRGGSTTRACASQLIHAFLKHGEAGKPAIGLKVRLSYTRKTLVKWARRGTCSFLSVGTAIHMLRGKAPPPRGTCGDLWREQSACDVCYHTVVILFCILYFATFIVVKGEQGVGKAVIALRV